MVIGGGPGGAVTAALLARAGISTTLLEREEFPRYHIGESIASSCRAILAYAGVLDKIEERGYPVKLGILLRWGRESDWRVDWRELFGPGVQSWQVDRDDFDKVLLDHAAAEGVEVIQANAKKVIFEDERAVAVQWVPSAGDDTPQTTAFDYIVDASGRNGLISNRHFKNRQPHDFFRNVAIWGYWTGGKLLPGTPGRGINVVSSNDGWYWVIPLRADRYSIGFVSRQDWFLARRKQHSSDKEMLLSLIAESATVSELLSEATYQHDVRIERDFSYVAAKFCGPGYFAVGDAACFLDPLLSTGVHLAMYSGMLSAACIISIENGDVTEQEAQSFYESLFRNAYERLYALVSGVYDKYIGKDGYFDMAQTLVRDEAQQEKKADAAFGELIAGMTDLKDAGRVGGAASIREFVDAADEARRRATSAYSQSFPPGVPVDTIRVNPADLYDRASGLYLAMEPRLAIRRAERALQPEGASAAGE